jgi:hypothetical protein
LWEPEDSNQPSCNNKRPDLQSAAVIQVDFGLSY